AGSVHEMGHVFGLKHVCAPKATKRTPTNIMTSAECKLGSGGLRNLGFTPVQLQTILSTYNQYP
ncbi:metalloprotease, partial [Acinetobacter radioresistens]